MIQFSRTPQPLYRPLGEEGIERIHQAALKVLTTTGMKVEHAGLRDNLAKAGCSADGDIVRFPPELVSERCAEAPRRVVLHHRGDREPLVLENTNVYMGTGGAAVEILEPGTSAARPTTAQDLLDACRVVDSMEWIDFLVRPCIPQDVAPGRGDLTLQPNGQPDPVSRRADPCVPGDARGVGRPGIKGRTHARRRGDAGDPRPTVRVEAPRRPRARMRDDVSPAVCKCHNPQPFERTRL